ncbi:MAG: hypothetical protein IGNPGNKH_00357 [Sodalis sp. Ffu]|nr:MAG: hypothetical protein IGNPGNKH_00357 [Sodalis sp. Ffu]
MIERLIMVVLMGTMLVGCTNNSTLSDDVYSASQAKQVQSVTYGTLVGVRPVQIQGGEDSNVIGALSGAVLGGLLGNTVGGGTGRNLTTVAGTMAGGWSVQTLRTRLIVSMALKWKFVKTMAIPLCLYRSRVIHILALGSEYY